MEHWCEMGLQRHKKDFNNRHEEEISESLCENKVFGILSIFNATLKHSKIQLSATSLLGMIRTAFAQDIYETLVW